MIKERIEYTHDGVTFEGYLVFNDELSGKRPTVLVSHAYGGLTQFESSGAIDPQSP